MSKRSARRPRDPAARVVTRNPTPGKDGTRMPRWKYDAVRRAILKSVPSRGDGVPANDLPVLVRDELPRAALVDLGSVSWHTTIVTRDLEARGELRRLPGRRPPRLVRRVGAR